MSFFLLLELPPPLPSHPFPSSPALVFTLRYFWLIRFPVSVLQLLSHAAAFSKGDSQRDGEGKTRERVMPERRRMVPETLGLVVLR